MKIQNTGDKPMIVTACGVGDEILSVQLSREGSMGEIVTFQTSTVLSCSRCKTEIKMFTDVCSDGKDYWHATCPGEPSKTSVETTKDDTTQEG